jgi:hypothetical protein
MSRHLAARVALGYLAISALLVGVWAAAAPHSFFADFPGFGHTWAGVDGPYNEHLVRDVGELNLALFVVTVAACLWRSRGVAIAAALAWIVYSVPHLAYHAFNLDVLSSGDGAAEIVALVIPIVVAGVVLALTGRDDRSTSGP